MITAMVQKESFLQTLLNYKWDYKQKMEIVNRSKMSVFILPLN